MSRKRLLFLLVATGVLLVVWMLASAPLSKAARTEGSVKPAATDRYVSTTGTDSGGCTGAGSPCRTIQFAVDAAGSGDRVLVAGGVYTDVHARNAMTQVVYISKSLTLMGDYTNTFTTRDDATILYGNGRGRLFYIAGPPTSSISVTLDGFGLGTGNATAGGMPSGPAHGGAILSYGGTLNLVDVAITGNEAPDSGARGGGLFHEFGTLFIEDSEFNVNSAGGSGGGLGVRSAQLHMRDTHFNKNAADGGGGVDLDTVTAWMTNTIFFENSATFYGSGMSTGGSDVYMWHTSLTLDGYFNSALFAGHDIYGQPSTIQMTNTLAVSHTVAISAASGLPGLQNTVELNGVLWNGNQQNTGGGGTITVTNAYTGNPDFTFEGFFIGANSAAIGHGVPSPVSTDYGGDRRVGAPDLGADEYAIVLYVPVTMRNY